jgi:glutaredoxin
MFQIMLYSVPMCEPCKNLKKWPNEKNISYCEQNIRSLDEAGRENVKKKIMTVSQFDHATVPAVCIRSDTGEHWISNHGQCDVSNMIREIQIFLASL